MTRADGAAKIDWNREGIDGAAGALPASSGRFAAVRGTRLVWTGLGSLGVPPLTLDSDPRL